MKNSIIEVADYITIVKLGSGYDGVKTFDDKIVRTAAEHNKFVASLKKQKAVSEKPCKI